tara:strand:+ start:280 stop:624 length:345 start_codon:yes stop_codon:yes gene_type:complete
MELTDLEICKRVAEINGDNVLMMQSVLGFNWMIADEGHGGYKPYNPLTDDALCFQSMVKYKITVEFTRYYEHLKSTTTKAYYDDEADNGYGAYIRDINPNKAICLAIIEANKQS